jgi:hypothetical protein
MDKTAVSLTVLFGRGSLSLALEEEYRLRVSENREGVMFGPEGDEVRGDWRKLRAEELHIDCC